MKKILFLSLLLAALGGAFAFFFYQMERNELLRAREELHNRYYPIENQILTLSDEVAALGSQMGDFRPLEESRLSQIAKGKETLLREERAESKRPAMQKLYAEINLFAEDLERYPDLFRDKEFLKKVNALKTSLEQLRLSARRYNESATAYNQRLTRPLSGLVARGEKWLQGWPLLTLPAGSAGAETAAASSATP